MQEHVQECHGKEILLWWAAAGFSSGVETFQRWSNKFVFISYLSVPWLSSTINPELNRVELRPVETSDDRLSMCVQYERDGKCQASLHVAGEKKQVSHNTK